MSSPPNHVSLLTLPLHPGQTFPFGGRSISLYQLNYKWTLMYFDFSFLKCDTFVSGYELQQYKVLSLL